MDDILRDPLKSPLIGARVSFRPGSELRAAGHEQGRVVMVNVNVQGEIDRTERLTGEPETGLREWLARRGPARHFVAVEADNTPRSEQVFLCLMDDCEVM